MPNQEATNKFVPSKHRNPSQTIALPVPTAGTMVAVITPFPPVTTNQLYRSYKCGNFPRYSWRFDKQLFLALRLTGWDVLIFPTMDISHLNTHLVCGITPPDRSRSNLAVDVFGLKYFVKTDIEHFFIYQKNTLLLLIGQAPLAWAKSSYDLSSFFYDNSASCLCCGFNFLVVNCFFFPIFLHPLYAHHYKYMRFGEAGKS